MLVRGYRVQALQYLATLYFGIIRERAHFSFDIGRTAYRNELKVSMWAVWCL